VKVTCWAVRNSCVAGYLVAHHSLMMAHPVFALPSLIGRLTRAANATYPSDIRMADSIISLPVVGIGSMLTQARQSPATSSVSHNNVRMLNCG